MDRSPLDPISSAAVTRAVATRQSASSARVSPDQWAVLALLRFCLASVVVIGHCYLYAATAQDWTVIGLNLNPLSAVFGFLVLSGFSISASLDHEPSHYYFRRFVRIWPLYLSALGVGLAVTWQFPAGVAWRHGQVWLPPTRWSIIASVAMLQGILAAPIPIVGQIWSLSVEWWHYMIAPCLKRTPSFRLAYIALASLAVFISISPPRGPSPSELQSGLALLALSWLWLCGFLYHRHRATLVGFVLLALPAFAACYCGSFTGIPLFITIFIVIVCGKFSLSDRTRRAFSFLGDVSYPLYLCHTIVMALWWRLGIKATLPMVVGSLLASVVLLYVVDFPCRKLLWRFWMPNALPRRHQIGRATEVSR